MVIVAPSINILICPRVTVKATKTMQQPTMIANPIGKPLRPTLTGSWSYVLKAWVGQNMRTETRNSQFNILYSSRVKARDG